MPQLSVILSNVFEEYAPLEFALRNLAAQTCQDFELIMIDAYYWQNATKVKELGQSLRLNIQHTPAMEASHTGRWMHWELHNNALLLARCPWIFQHGVYRYLHKEAIGLVLNNLARGVCTVFYQDRAVHPEANSMDELESLHQMNVKPEPIHYLSQSGFFSIPREILIERLNGHNEALVLHHWIDSDLSERARHLTDLKVELVAHGLLRIDHPSWIIERRSERADDWTIRKSPLALRGRQTCHPTKTDCVVWQLREMALAGRTKIDAFTRVHHSGFDWVACQDCGAVGIEDPGKYLDHLADPACINAPINVYGIGRNLSTLNADLAAITGLIDRVNLIAGSHDNTRYLQ